MSAEAFAIIVQIVRFIGPVVIATAIAISVHAILLHVVPRNTGRVDAPDLLG